MQMIGLIVPAGFELSSFAPLTVFEAANAVLGERRYITRLLSESGGPQRGALGVEVITQPLGEPTYDTLIVAGTSLMTVASVREAELLQAACHGVRRIASIRLGAFMLAEAGLLDGRRATTHWAFVEELQRRFPAITVEIDSIFVEDGPIWTSAGMTAGVDPAVGMLERDIGVEATLDVARQLVVGQRRQARDPQLPMTLALVPKSDRVQRALSHARANLRAALTVEELAEAACLSPRQFGRVFVEETGCSPARAIEKLRLEAAKLLISSGRLTIEAIAYETGFRDADRMRRAFHRAFGKGPGAVRRSAEHRIAI